MSPAAAASSAQIPEHGETKVMKILSFWFHGVFLKLHFMPQKKVLQ
jgi:hypothetical protein